MSRFRMSGLVAALVITSAPAASNAIIIPLQATLDCSQTNAGVGTCDAGGSGTGFASITLDDATNLLSWNLTWSDLSAGPATSMHFHGPATPFENAGIQVAIGSISGITSPSIGSTTISSDQAAELLSHLWYINIHTNAFPAGEIRGQVVPEPTTLLLVAGGLAGLAAGRRGVYSGAHRRGSGRGPAS